MSDQARTVIKVKDLDITFKMATGDVHAIRGVDYELKENEVLALLHPYKLLPAAVIMILLMGGCHLVAEGVKKANE